MTPSLCVVLPVRNVEATLASLVGGVLDAAEETGVRFEVVIVDNGSRDDTWEVICELARRFPQIAAVHSPDQIGLGQIIESTRNRTQAGWICVHRGVGAVVADEVVWLWHAHAAGRNDRLENGHPGTTFGFQLLPRTAQASSTSTSELACRIALIKRVARRESSRYLQRDMLCHTAVSDLNLAK